MVNPSIKIVASVLQVVFLALKLAKVVTWPWLVVITPTITFVLIILLSYALLGYWLVYALASLMEEAEDDDD